MLDHWRDRRSTYVDPNTRDELPERRQAWSRIGPGQLALYVTVVVIIVVGYARFGAVANRADRQNQALCALRDDLHSRVTETESFLVRHPQGVPDIDRETLVASLRNARRSFDALARLEC